MREDVPFGTHQATSAAAEAKLGITKHQAIALRASDNEVFDALLIPRATELRERMNALEDAPYFGPNDEIMLALDQELYPEGFRSFTGWA